MEGLEFTDNLLKSQTISIIVGILGATLSYIVHEVQHNRTARFDLALSKVYDEIAHFLKCSNKINNNVNLMSREYIYHKNAEELDNWITTPITALENSAVMIGMFFSQSKRKVLNEIVEIVRNFNIQVHQAFSEVDEFNRGQEYDKALREFNKLFKPALNEVVNMINSTLLGAWQKENWLCKRK